MNMQLIWSILTYLEDESKRLGSLGHSDVQTGITIYAHVTKKAKEEVIMKFASYIELY